MEIFENNDNNEYNILNIPLQFLTLIEDNT